MNKKLKWGSAFAMAAAIAIGVFQHNTSNLEFSDLCLSNIEALANPGESDKKGDVGLQCTGSCVIICKITCPSCLSIWQSIYTTGNCVGVRGVCTCGHKFQ